MRVAAARRRSQPKKEAVKINPLETEKKPEVVREHRGHLLKYGWNKPPMAGELGSCSFEGCETEATHFCFWSPKPGGCIRCFRLKSSCEKPFCDKHLVETKFDAQDEQGLFSYTLITCLAC